MMMRVIAQDASILMISIMDTITVQLFDWFILSIKGSYTIKAAKFKQEAQLLFSDRVTRRPAKDWKAVFEILETGNDNVD